MRPIAILSAGILCLVFALKASGPATSTLTGGITIDSDPCLPPAGVDVIFDDRKITAIDSENGQVVHSLEGELVRQSLTCGNVALVLGERNIYFYSAQQGKWTRRPVRNSDQMIGTSRFFNFALGRNTVIFSTFVETHFFHAATGVVTSVSLYADRLRGVLAYDTAACVITDRRVYCSQEKGEDVRIFPLNDMHIRTAKATAGKIIMQAPEKTLIYYAAKGTFEFIPLRK